MINKNILIIKNISHEGPGLISNILEKNGLEYDIIDLSKRIKFPKVDKFGLIIIMGGPDSANDKSEKILKELNYVKLVLEKKVPIFGICLGLQLMVKAFGGTIYKNPVQEIGFKLKNEWNKIRLTSAGLKDPIFKGIKNNFITFHLHAETVKLTDDIILLGKGKFCKNQVIKIGNLNYGFQFHFELTNDLLKNWIEKAPELKEKNLSQILSDFRQIKESFIKRGNKIFENYIKLINYL